MNEIVFPIEGLKFEPRFRLDNGPDSFVVPFPTRAPVNIVYHGTHEFAYGHYGIHLGQEDRLTFMGPSNKNIRAFFIDCREGSPTKHLRFECEFKPSTHRTLLIPPGVAHSFVGLETVFTLNTYRSYLPDPNDWLEGRSLWNMQNDVINLPMNVADSVLPTYRPNTHLASTEYLSQMTRNQREAFASRQIEYPFTYDFHLGEKNVTLQMKRKTSERAKPELEVIGTIDGLAWRNHPVILSGEHSGFVPLLNERPFYIVDHGETFYSHDAYGIHLGQKDCLTFLGDPNQKARVSLVDCREDSPTRHQKMALDFKPDPTRALIIPPGVAHAFEGLEKIHTLNQAEVFLDSQLAYDSSNDVIDWLLDRNDYPSLKVNRIAAWGDYYQKQVENQERAMQNPPRHSTPIILLRRDLHGKLVKVALRKKTQTSYAA